MMRKGGGRGGGCLAAGAWALRAVPYGAAPCCAVPRRPPSQALFSRRGEAVAAGPASPVSPAPFAAADPVVVVVVVVVVVAPVATAAALLLAAPGTGPVPLSATSGLPHGRTRSPGPDASSLCLVLLGMGGGKDSFSSLREPNFIIF